MIKRIFDVTNSLNISEYNLPLVIGTFDVVHLGHYELFKNLQSKQFNILLITNSPKTDIYINTIQNRIKSLSNFDPWLIYYFDVNKNNLEANQFINQILKKINPCKIIVGSDFKFGKKAIGDTNLLQQYFNTIIIEKDNKYQTRKIKEYYLQGEVFEANKLLYLPIWYTEKITKGKQIGRTYGYPTLNLLFTDPKQIIPSNGVYASIIMYGENLYNSATYISKKNNQTLVETFVIDEKLPFDNYGKEVSIQFLKRIDYVKILQENTIEQRKQVKKMVNLVKEYFQTK